MPQKCIHVFVIERANIALVRTLIRDGGSPTSHPIFHPIYYYMGMIF
jgi:hypothetical protein